MNVNSSAALPARSLSAQPSVMKEYERLLGRRYDPEKETLDLSLWSQAAWQARKRYPSSAVDRSPAR